MTASVRPPTLHFQACCRPSLDSVMEHSALGQAIACRGYMLRLHTHTWILLEKVHQLLIYLHTQVLVSRRLGKANLLR